MRARAVLWGLTVVLTAVITGFWCVGAAGAAEQGQFTRADYTEIMRWVNFIILAALIVKYARRPVANFLKEKNQQVASAIQKLEDQKRQAQEKIRQSQIDLETAQARFALINERIIAEGQRRKTDMIAEAQNESRIMLDTARLKIDAQIREARERIKTELIDAAAELAAARLSQMITANDHERLIRRWMEAARQ